MQTPTEPRLTRLHERLARCKILSLSLAFHTAIIAILGGIILIKVSEPPEADFGPGYALPDIEISKEPDPSLTAQQPPEMTGLESAAKPEIQLPKTQDVAVVHNIRANIGAITVRADIPQIRLSSLAMETPKISTGIGQGMQLRMGQDREGRIITGTGMRGSGSTKESEQSVLRALAWLASVQREDGSWGERNRGAMTGLALLCFLGHGEYGQTPKFGLTVNRAIDWILQNGTANQSRLSMTADGWGAGNAGVYEHGIATYALGEYYTMTRLTGHADERVLELLRGAVAHITGGQGPDGGWMYSFDKTQSDTSVSGWQVQALKAAHLSGLNIPGVDTALDRAMLNFQRVQTDKGAYGYRKAEDRWSLTGVGLLCELFWKNTRDKETRRSAEYIMNGLAENPIQYQHPKADLYAWYYHTQAVLMFGGTSWKKWDAMFSNELIKSQASDGSWPPMSNPAHGNLQKDPSVTGAIYRTTLSVLMLEAYYRYLPTTR